MTREDIIRLAQESGLKDLCGLETTGWPGDARVDALIDFAALVAAAVLAEPEPEPVAWMEAPHGAIRANPLYRIYLPSSLLTWSIPLYIHPPKARDWAANAIRARGQ